MEPSPDSKKRKRMGAASRRQQMLEMAAHIVRQEGVSALTLARAAEASGVSKPIAYQHFGTREGLLAALYVQLGAHHEAAVLEALEANRSGRLEAVKVAEIISTAFIDCVLENGPLFNAISAALAASGADNQAARADFTQRYAAILARFINVDGVAGYGLTVAFLGAGEHLSNALLRGEVSRATTINALMLLLLAARKDAC